MLILYGMPTNLLPLGAPLKAKTLLTASFVVEGTYGSLGQQVQKCECTCEHLYGHNRALHTYKQSGVNDCTARGLSKSLFLH
eukprot:10917-Pelagomonas_calceolata.AAC.1